MTTADEATIDSLDDINIILLGETGVGKTTFLNALMNMLHYRDLDHGLANELKVLIPSCFTITDSETFDDVQVMCGSSDGNESDKPGESSTQQCRSYIFRFGHRRLRIIDTPGVGDVRGPDQEQKNFDNILAYLSHFQHLNGILFLLKPTQTRLNIYFRYCARELLRYLHKNAKDNILFVFTNSRASHYRPGSTAAILKSWLNELKSQSGIEIPFNAYNTFMLDSEPYRFLAASKHGIQFSTDEKEQYQRSWQHNEKELTRLMKQVLSCEEYLVKNTISLGAAAQMIRILSRPIAEVARLIQANHAMAEDYKKKVESSDPSVNLEHQPQIEGRLVLLPIRLTVCTQVNCTRVVVVNGLATIDYYKHCHEDCRLHQVVQECIGDPALKMCWAMQGKESCQECGCHWTKHMHVTYRIENSPTEIKFSANGETVDRESILAQVQRRINELSEEEKKIREITANISKFIRVNSLNPHSDDILEYTQLFLQEERQKQSINGNDSGVIRALERMIEEHKLEILTFEKLLETEKNNPGKIRAELGQIDFMFELVSRLYRLPIYGKAIREQVEVVRRQRQETVDVAERFIDLPTQSECGSTVLAEFWRLIQR